MKTPLDYSKQHLYDLDPGQSTVDATLPTLRNICMFIRHEADFTTDLNWTNIDPTAIIFICLSGEGRLIVKNGVCELSEGQGILIMPFQQHHRIPFLNHKVEYLLIRFNMEHADFLEELDSTRFYLNDAARGFLNSFIESYQKGEETNSPAEKCACALYLLQLLNSVRGTTMDSMMPSGMPARFMAVCKSLLATGSDYSNISEIAASLGITPNYLSIYFKKVSGRTPSSMKVIYQKLRSEQLLLNTSLSIGKIASELNFGSIYSFSRFFKHHSGLSPSQYRAKFGKASSEK